MTVAERLAGWADGLDLADVPPAVRAAARRHLLDGLGTTIAGARSGNARPAVTVATGLGGPPESTIVGTGTRVSAPAAALANGTQLHALDYDDTHAGGLVHATAVVLPAAFAVGEQVGASGADVLRAAVAGYETVCRIAAASPHGFHARGLHATATAGVFSTALITSLLTKAPISTTVNALGIAGSTAGGLLEFLNTGSATKRLHPGLASANGIVAARLATAGASGPATVLEGDRGFYAALSGRPADPESVVEGLGDRWETTRIGIKPYPACQLLHVTLDAVAAVLAEIAGPDQVASVVADVHPDSAPTVAEPAAVKVTPRTTYDAQFSLPWSVAALITDGRVDLATYAPASIARPEVAALAARVTSRLTDGRGAAADAAGHVEVTLTDGRTLVGDVPRSRGTSSAPLSDAEVAAKFAANCGDSPLAGDLAGVVLDLDRAASLADVFDLAHRIVQEHHA